MSYHSALKKYAPDNNAQPINSFKTKNCLGFVYDIENDLVPDVFTQAQFVYCEPPYRAGYRVFNDRANKSEGGGWLHLIYKASEICQKLNVPAYLILGAEAKKVLPWHRRPIRFTPHNEDAWLYYTHDPGTANDTNGLILDLFTKYDTGLDFMAGYGNVAMAAQKTGKTAIVTDLNPKCLAVIQHRLNENPD